MAENHLKCIFIILITTGGLCVTLVIVLCIIGIDVFLVMAENHLKFIVIILITTGGLCVTIGIKE